MAILKHSNIFKRIGYFLTKNRGIQIGNLHIGPEIQKFTPSNPTAAIANIDGKLVMFSVCSDKKDMLLDNTLEYIGVGTLYSINGITVNDSLYLHFWRKP
jgi:hypothetical protein